MKRGSNKSMSSTILITTSRMVGATRTTKITQTEETEKNDQKAERTGDVFINELYDKDQQNIYLTPFRNNNTLDANKQVEFVDTIRPENVSQKNSHIYDNTPIATLFEGNPTIGKTISSEKTASYVHSTESFQNITLKPNNISSAVEWRPTYFILNADGYELKNSTHSNSSGYSDINSAPNQPEKMLNHSYLLPTLPISSNLSRTQDLNAFITTYSGLRHLNFYGNQISSTGTTTLMDSDIYKGTTRNTYDY